ncbi:MAG: acyl-ACP thioesterase [Odoribacteraceae bacterium]|jgi:acyl-ACP thioesterase|nr:acyl-ACP thioesterase [Odoribacteraceae bacterium]
MLKLSKKITICNHHVDFRGRLGAKTLCDLFNDAANEQTIALGVDVDTFNASGITWMLHRIRLQVTRWPSKGEEIILETWPSGSDRLFAFRDFAVFSSSGQPLVRSTSEWMVIDLERRRPVRLPESVSRMAAYHEGITREITFELDSKRLPLDVTGSRRFVASYDTIDFNRHVTQASYVGWVTHALPFDFSSHHQLTELEMLYEREILPDSEVNSIYFIEENDAGARVWHRVVDASGAVTHCAARGAWSREESAR